MTIHAINATGQRPVDHAHEDEKHVVHHLDPSSITEHTRLSELQTPPNAERLTSRIASASTMTEQPRGSVSHLIAALTYHCNRVMETSRDTGESLGLLAGGCAGAGLGSLAGIAAQIYKGGNVNYVLIGIALGCDLGATLGSAAGKRVGNAAAYVLTLGIPLLLGLLERIKENTSEANPIHENWVEVDARS